MTTSTKPHRVVGAVRRLAGWGAVALLAGATACEKVPAPTSDVTPPALTWRVENRTTEVVTTLSGGGAVSGRLGDTYRVTLTADDPQGIHRITLGGGYTRICQSPGVGGTGSGSYAGQQQTLRPDQDGNVLTRIFLLQSIDPDVDCSGGLTWGGTDIGLNGTGTNYFNGTTQGQLTISIRP